MYEKSVFTLQPAQHSAVYPGCHLKHSKRKENLGFSHIYHHDVKNVQIINFFFTCTIASKEVFC